ELDPSTNEAACSSSIAVYETNANINNNNNNNNNNNGGFDNNNNEDMKAGEKMIILTPSLFEDLEREVTKENMVQFLSDINGRDAFLDYLKTHHCEENLLCWVCIPLKLA